MRQERTVEERIAVIERRVDSELPGTMLYRTSVAFSPSGFGWGLSVGGHNLPKRHYYDTTIDGVLSQAEKYLKIHPRGKAMKGDAGIS